MILDEKVKIIVFPAAAGDCFLVEFIEEDYRVLIDGGYRETYQKYLKKYLRELAIQGKSINLLVITHIDSDHIGGIQSFLQENGSAKQPEIIRVEEVWYNSFPHMYKGIVCKEPVPYTIKSILSSCLYANNNLLPKKGRQDISVAQGNTVSKLLAERGYRWNSMWAGKAVCVSNGTDLQLTDKIKCKLLNPDERQLHELAGMWIGKLRNRVKKFVVCEDTLYSEAFESYLVQNSCEHEIEIKDIAAKNTVESQVIDWMDWLDEWSGQVDESKTNRSSIAFMLEYEGISMLFPGDCPIQLFQDRLPKKIDVVKLPHHGSEKNINKEFISTTNVAYYILSTNGIKHGHPSRQVIANILYEAPKKTELLKNYDIFELKDVGSIMRDKNEYNE